MEEWLQFDWRAGWGTNAFEDKVFENPDAYDFPERWQTIDARYAARDIIEENLDKLLTIRERRMELLRNAISEGHDHAHETTLGGTSLPRMIARAAETHEVHLWYCGLATPELHIARVQARVAAGGHAIDRERIRQRWTAAPRNLIELMPKLTALRVYDNSVTAAPGEPIPEPELLIEVRQQVVRQPAADDLEALTALPEWAHPIAEAALSNDSR
jgi:predicted ABC-type ATPase